MIHFVYPSKIGLARIVQHGRGWRALLGEQEIGRHDTAEAALLALRIRWPKARIPSSFLLWRQLPEPQRIGHRRVQRKEAA